MSVCTSACLAQSSRALHFHLSVWIIKLFTQVSLKAPYQSSFCSFSVYNNRKTEPKQYFVWLNLDKSTKNKKGSAAWSLMLCECWGWYEVFHSVVSVRKLMALINNHSMKKVNKLQSRPAVTQPVKLYCELLHWIFLCFSIFCCYFKTFYLFQKKVYFWKLWLKYKKLHIHLFL